MQEIYRFIDDAIEADRQRYTDIADQIWDHSAAISWQAFSGVVSSCLFFNSFCASIIESPLAKKLSCGLIKLSKSGNSPKFAIRLMLAIAR